MKRVAALALWIVGALAAARQLGQLWAALGPAQLWVLGGLAVGAVSVWGLSRRPLGGLTGLALGYALLAVPQLPHGVLDGFRAGYLAGMLPVVGRWWWITSPAVRRQLPAAREEAGRYDQ